MSKKSRPATGWANRPALVRLNVIICLIGAALIGLVFNPLTQPTEAKTTASNASVALSYNIANTVGAVSAKPNVSATLYNVGEGQSQPQAIANDTINGPTQVNGQEFEYFNSTGHSISGPLFHFYQQTGGTARHGAPLSEIVSVKGHYWQFFQNSVVEFDPRYVGTSSEAKLIPLGAQMAAHYDFPPVTPFANTPDRWYFPESGHSLNSGFLNFWLNNGDRATLGLPFSEEIPTQDAQGHPVTYQYFEYVRLEYHPNVSDAAQRITISPLGQQQASTLLPPTTLLPVAMNLLTAARTVRIPSLMIHYIRLVDPKKDPLGFGLSITPDNFVHYLDYLQQNGFHTVTISQIYDYLHYGIALPDKAISLRFDDGYISHWFAYQELHKRGMTATFFVITRHLELTPQQWQQIDRDGFEVAAHTRTHPDLRGVSDLAAEITGSKTDLEAMLGHPVRTFAYPYGSYNANIVKVVKDSGFEVAVSTNGGVDWNMADTLIEPTLGVTGRDDLNTFIAKAELRVAGLSPVSSSSSSTTTAKPVTKYSSSKPNLTPAPAKTKAVVKPTVK